MTVKNETNFPIVITEKDKQIILLPGKEGKVNGKSKHVRQLIKLGYLSIKEDK